MRESGIRSYLSIFYLFLALATLAKGPVAPFFAFVIIAAFCTLHRDYRLLWRTLATPWALLFPAVAFPWYIAVQLRNPEFFRVFILEHNLARFGTDLYHHGQPFWFYVPVILLALLPWTIFVAQALIESLRLWWSDRDLRVDREHSFNIFLILWLIIPVVFFSFSKSKLPGYILPAVPAGTLLLAEYVRRHVTEGVRPPFLVTLLHSIVAAQLLIPALMIQHILLNHRLPWGMPLAVAGCAAVVLATSMMLTLRSNLGLRMLRFVTLVPVVLVLAVVLRTHAPVVDAAFSVRPLARDIARVEAGNLPTAVFRVSREIEYGLAFYRNQTVQNYNIGQVPMRDHLLVTAEGTWPILAREMPNRRISFLGNYAPLHLEYYWISAPGAYSSQHHSHQ